MITLTPAVKTSTIFTSYSKKASLSIGILVLPSLLGLSVAQAADEVKPDVEKVNLDLFLHCTELKLGAARLACYDKMVSGGTVTIGKDKQPLDIGASIKQSIAERSPKAVLADKSPQITLGGDEVIYSGVPTRAGNERLSKAGITAEDFSAYTPLSLTYDLDKNSELGLWTPRPHNSLYLMPLFAHFDPNRSPSTPTQEVENYDKDSYQPLELKAQISLKSKVAEDLFSTNADLWFGYTQQMHWQVYNGQNSRPFRATDYMPEIFITQPVTASLPFNGKLRMLGAGAIHHSNGQDDPLSRSWNRAYLMAGAEWGKLTVVPKVWTHVESGGEGDNPDIVDYYGHGELEMQYDFGTGHSLSATGRYNFDKENGALELNYIYPITDQVNGFMQMFHGYGESIVDYNDETTSVGVGIALRDWQGL